MADDPPLLPPLRLASLRGTVCVVTGAAHLGIGFGIALHAASIGMHIAILDLDLTTSRAAAARIREAHPSIAAIGVACDVTAQASSLAAAAAHVRRRFPGKRLGGIFACAGVSLGTQTVTASPIDAWRTTFDINVLGVASTLQAFLPWALEASEPCVVTATSSFKGVDKGGARLCAYSASKHAVVAIMEGLAQDLAAAGHAQVRAAVILPCFVRTRMMMQQGGITEDDAALALTPAAHAQQVFDRLVAGEFYLLCDSTRPYVDHDFPFGAALRVRARLEGIKKRHLDHAPLPSPYKDELARRRRRRRRAQRRMPQPPTPSGTRLPTIIDLSTLAGTVCVVTGAGHGGIGFGICERAARDLGMHVAIVDLTQDVTDGAVARLRRRVGGTGQIRGFAADVTDHEAMASCAAQVHAAFSGCRVGALFANAGVAHLDKDSLLASSIDRWRHTMAVNVLGVVNTIQAFVPRMKATAAAAAAAARAQHEDRRVGGIVCTTASIMGLALGSNSFGGCGCGYAASKHAVVALTESLDAELAATNISAHVCCPCIVRTRRMQTSAEQVPARHAEQLLDLIGSGAFYCVTEQNTTRPFVDHGAFPLNAAGMIERRTQGLLRRRIEPPVRSPLIEDEEEVLAIFRAPAAAAAQQERARTQQRRRGKSKL